MDELRFVLKSFAAAALIIALSQIKTSEGTIETQIESALVSSETAAFVNQAAHGGVKTLKQFGSFVKEKLESTKNNKNEEPDAEETSKPLYSANKPSFIQNKKSTQQAAINKIQRDEVRTPDSSAIEPSDEDSINDLIQEVE